MKLYEIVFSATGRTQKVVDSISPIFAEEKIKIDLSEPNAENKIYNFSEDSFCIVAVPVYGGRVPTPAVNRLHNINGNGANALLVAVYGNRAIDDCLLELKNILTEQGFKCRAAISAVAEHSMMPNFATTRPDSKDQEELKNFALQIKEKLDNNTLSESVRVPGKMPYVKAANLPLKIEVNQDCIKCGKCSIRCPVGAIPFDNPSCTNSKKCITCMRCISECPQNARALSPALISIVSVAMKSKFKGRKENTLYI